MNVRPGTLISPGHVLTAAHCLSHVKGLPASKTWTPKLEQTKTRSWMLWHVVTRSPFPGLRSSSDTHFCCMWTFLKNLENISKNSTSIFIPHPMQAFPRKSALHFDSLDYVWLFRRGISPQDHVQSVRCVCTLAVGHGFRAPQVLWWSAKPRRPMDFGPVGPVGL